MLVRFLCALVKRRLKFLYYVGISEQYTKSAHLLFNSIECYAEPSLLSSVLTLYVRVPGVSLGDWQNSSLSLSSAVFGLARISAARERTSSAFPRSPPDAATLLGLEEWKLEEMVMLIVTKLKTLYYS